jgi:hypothetical protein
MVEHATGFSRVGDMAQADCVLLPYTEVFEEYPDDELRSRWGLSRGAAQALKFSYAQLKRNAHSRDITVIAATHSDFEWRSPVPNSITFQTSLRRSTRRERDFALAGFTSSDLASANGGRSVPLSEWRSRPSVGFQGSARRTDHSAERHGRDLATWLAGRARFGGALLERAAWNEGQMLRAESMDALRRSGDIDCDFNVVTRGYLRASPSTREANRRTFTDNLLRNPYALCVRGRGNFSYRLYEVMSLGRIPLFIDTECVLPFDHLVDWPSELAWVSRDMVGKSAAILRAFHDEHHGPSLPAAQLRIRDLFDTWCRPEPFWSKAGEIVAGCL